MFMKLVLCLQSDHVEMFHGIELTEEVMFEWTNCTALLDFTMAPIRQ